jgi:hypothetical protein
MSAALSRLGTPSVIVVDSASSRRWGAAELSVRVVAVPHHGCLKVRSGEPTRSRLTHAVSLNPVSGARVINSGTGRRAKPGFLGEPDPPPVLHPSQPRVQRSVAGRSYPVGWMVAN